MKMTKPYVHFIDNSLLRPYNPVSVNLIGAGGTGSQVLAGLARINYALQSLGHPGLQVNVFDADTVSAANIGRQLFTEQEIGLSKAVALVNRFNRAFGTDWKAWQTLYNKNNYSAIGQKAAATITITCTDTAASRFEVAEILKKINKKQSEFRDCPLYWLDFGNSRYTGQVIVATIDSIKQPTSKKFNTVAYLPSVTEQFAHLLKDKQEDNTPSCSLAEALTQQDLFINPSLAQLGGSLLWRMFREGMLMYRGFFLNLNEYGTRAIPVG